MPCRLCRENFVAGIEAYGGLGTSLERSLSDTRHFIAPVVSWRLPNRSTIKASTAFGLSEASERYLFRIGCAFEVSVGGR
jgi:hypothetical protein